MGNYFDIASKYPFDIDPAGMLKICGLTIDGPVSPYKTDLSTRLEADRLFRVDGKSSWLAHIEIQSGFDQFLDLRVERYNISAEYQVALDSEFREHLPVLSTVVLLHSKANSLKLTGNRIRIGPDRKVYGKFRYNVIKLWQIPVEKLLNGPLACLAFAPLAKSTKDKVPDVVEQIERRLSNEAEPDLAKELRTNAWLLMGLKFKWEFINSCPWRKELMHESSTYQHLLEEGIEQGIEKGIQKGIQKGIEKGIEKGLQQGIGQGVIIGKQEVVLNLGRRKWGPPTKAVQKSLNAIVDPKMLDQFIVEIEHAQSWGELMKLGKNRN